MFTLLATFGSTSFSVFGAVVAHVPSERVHFCSNNCAFVVYCAGGICDFLLGVTW